jgi:hypothetical protein
MTFVAQAMRAGKTGFRKMGIAGGHALFIDEVA